MRNPASYRVTRVRLVNFHNFVDETIELRGGGHLFLLGDNGSGKTTVLDALHYVLSGGDGIELNAAARLGGRRDEGRTIQGIALRFDFERGVRNEGGAIAYAAVELEAEGGARVCLAIGIEATTMEARPVRCGVITRLALEELPLLEGDVPSSREVLRERLGRSDVWFQLAEYRRQVADRFFGGEAGYREVCRFWSMAKAYREIVAGASDVGGLFRRLLPAPDGDTFAEILRSLRAIEEIEVALASIAEQRDYVGGIAAALDEVAEVRHAAARYRWLLAYREREDERARGSAAASRVGALGAAIDQAGRETAAAEAVLARTEEGVRAIERAEGGELLAARRRAAERAQEIEADAGRWEREAGSRDEARERAARAAARAAREVAVSLEVAADETERALSQTPDRPGAFREAARAIHVAREAARALDDAGGTDAAENASLDVVHAVAERARLEVAAALDAAWSDDVAAGVEVAGAAGMLDRARRARAEVAEAREDAPLLPDVAAALAALAAAGIEASALCECLEPAPGADEALVSDLERLAGPAVMGAVVVTPARAASALEVAVAAAPEARVVTRTVDVELPTWARGLIEPVGELGAVASSALAAALTQPAELGEVTAADRVSHLELRGLAFSAADRVPRLLGRAARRRARAEALARAEEAIRDAEHAHEAARARAVAAAAARAGVGALAAALERLSARTAPGATTAWAEACRRVTEVEGEAARARAESDAAGARLVAARSEARRLEEGVGAAGLAALELRLADARRARDEAAAIRDQHHRECVLREADRDRARREVDEATARISHLAGDLARAADELRRAAPAVAALGDDGVAHHVRVLHRGDSFRSTEGVRDKIREVERREVELAAELAGDGSRGVRFLGFAAQFGFAYDAAENRVVDRRDQPVAGILAELERTLEEQCELCGERTRDLMERLVMGSLARDLQAQVEALHRTVREINCLLAGLRFGPTEYQLAVTARAERAELVELVRSVSLLDDESRRAFRGWIEDRLHELRGAEEGTVPEVLDYRTWFDVRIRMRRANAEGIELTRSLRVLGSGGEQGVPNYLIVFALAKLLFDSTGAALRPLLFDEAFYGIDAGRRDQLLRFATGCGLQIAVASPDQDGATPSVTAATTLFVVKDDEGDVHLFPYHYWNRQPAQTSLLDDAAAPPDPRDAVCRT